MLGIPGDNLSTNIDNIIVIEHDLDVIANADYVIDMGPGGGQQGGRIVASGTPEEIAEHKESITGKYLKTMLERERKSLRKER